MKGVALLVLALVAMMPPLAACTPAAQQTAVTVTEAACVAVVSVEAPAAEPLCVLGQEIAEAVIAYVQAHGGSPPVVATSGARTVVSPDLYAALAARPAVYARRATPCQKLPAPVVAP